MPRRSRFIRSARKQTGRARRAFAVNGPGHRLMDSLGNSAYFFTLTPADLGVVLSDDASGLYDATVSALLAAVARSFRGPVYAVAEVGKGRPGRRGRLHVHVIAHRDDGPQHIRRDSQRCQPVYDVFGLYKYLAKPPEKFSLEAELDAAAARVLSPSGRLPNTRRHLVTAERLAWVASTYFPKHQTQPTDPQTAAEGTQPPPRPLDQPNACNPLKIPLEKEMSSERSEGDAPERSAGKTRHRPRPVPVHATHDRRQSPRRAPRPRARAPPHPPRRRPHHRRYDSTSSPPTRTETKVNDYRTEKLLELDQLTAALSPELEDVRRAHRIARRLRSPRLTPLGARRALFDARAVSTRLRRVHDLGKEKTQ